MTVADRCPGVLRAHPAEDGLVIRLRIPGGRTTGTALAAVSRLAGRYGNGDLQLTTRSGLQLRGLADPVPAGLVAELVALGFLPSARHDRVRNIVASPLTGIAGPVDLRPMITELDRAVLADDQLAELPGRFLFVLDDRTGDVSALPFDLGYRSTSAAVGDVLIGSTRCRIPVLATAAVPTLIRLARAFLIDSGAASGRGWHVRDLPGWAESRAEHVLPEPAPGLTPESPEAPLGVVAGAASVQVPLGLLTSTQATALATAAGAGPLVITPWRGVVVPGAAAALPDLVATGLVADPTSGWALVSACVGAPYCSRTSLDTRDAAAELVRGGVSERIHVSGCDRRCGAPTVPHRELVAR